MIHAVIFMMDVATLSTRCDFHAKCLSNCSRDANECLPTILAFEKSQFAQGGLIVSILSVCVKDAL